MSMLFSSTSFKNKNNETKFMLVHQRVLPLFQRAAREGISVDLEEVSHRYTFANVSFLSWLRLGLSGPRSPIHSFHKGLFVYIHAISTTFSAPFSFVHSADFIFSINFDAILDDPYFRTKFVGIHNYHRTGPLSFTWSVSFVIVALAIIYILKL